MPYRDPEKQRACVRAWYLRNKDRAKTASLRWRLNNPDKLRGHHLKNRYGISSAQFAEMLAAQDKRCAVCCELLTSRGAYVDHCHTTGAVRGLLCPGCNTLCGYLEHRNRAVAEEYLKKFHGSRPERV